MLIRFYFFFFKQKTAYEMRISDWSSDVCSSDLDAIPALAWAAVLRVDVALEQAHVLGLQLGGLHVVAGVPLQRIDLAQLAVLRSEERRVGKECVSTCRSRWSPYH